MTLLKPTLECGKIGTIVYNEIKYDLELGKWIGLSTACCYSQSTEFYLYDLSITTDESTEDDGYICIGGEIGGRYTQNESYKFRVDFDTESVYWNSGKVLTFNELKNSDDHYHFK